MSNQISSLEKHKETFLDVWIVPATGVKEVSSDAGSGAEKNVTFYQPDNKDDWYWLGHSNKNENLILVKPRRKNIIKITHEYKCAWYDEGSDKDLAYSLWNMSAIPNYVALGSIARFGKGRTDWEPPSGDEVKNLVYVHKSICVKGVIGNLIWDDKGSRTKKRNGSIWEVKSGSDGGLEANTFYCHDGYDKPQVDVYVIDEKKITII